MARIVAGNAIKRESTDRKGRVHVFPIKEKQQKGPARAKESIKSDLHQVMTNINNRESDYVVNGIKGPNCLMYSKHIDFVSGFAIDYMDGVCSGVRTLLLTLWFTKEHKHASF